MDGCLTPPVQAWTICTGAFVFPGIGSLVSGAGDPRVGRCSMAWAREREFLPSLHNAH